MPEINAVPIPPNGRIEVSLSPTGYRILHLKPQDALARKLFPRYVERCLNFIDEIGADTDPIWCAALLYNNFHNATNLIHCLVALDEQEKFLAHSLTYVDNSYKLGPHVHILQVWNNSGDRNILDQGLSLIENWTREIKCKTITYSADSLAKLRLYGRFGFQLYRVLGEKNLE